MTTPLEIFTDLGTFIFRNDVELGHVFVGLRRNGSDDTTPFGELRPDEQDAGWRAFDAFHGRR